MSESILTEKELGEALKSDKDTIVIEGELAGKVVRIRATGKVAWAVALGAIAIAITIVVVSGGTAAPGAALIGGPAIAVLGLSAAISAVSIGVAAGGVSGLKKLRKYKTIEKSDGRLVLKRN